MKKPLLILLIFVIVGALSYSVNAQVGIGTETPNPKAVLDLKSPGDNQGFLVPRLTTAQRNAIPALGSAEKGLLVFDSTVDKFYYWSGTAWTIIEDTSGTGTLTSINTGTGLTGGPITVSGTISLSNTTVTAGAYGTATQVPRLTIDAQGRITGVVLTTIAGVAPGGAAGGDLTGNYPNPTVANNVITTAKILDGTIVTGDLADASVTDVKVAAVAPSKLTAGGAATGQVLKWNGTNWTPQADAAGSGTVTNIATGAGLTGGPITTTGTISLADGGVTTIKIADNNVTTAKILDGTIATGDIADGAITDVKVTSVAPSKLTAAGATTGQVLKWNGTIWTPQADASGSGTVTNIVTGTGLTGGPITTTGTISLADGGVTTIKIADNNVTTAKILDGTIGTGDLADGSVTDVKITAVAPGKLTAAGATTGQVLKWNGANWTPQADAGGSGTVTNIATGAGLTGGPITATGTISLADGGVTTVKIADNNVTTAKILDGTIATADLADDAVTSAKLLDGTIVNADINASAAIAVTKVAAGTNGQVLLTSGTTPTWSAMPAPTGTAGGDLNGTYPNPTVDGLQGRPVATTLPTSGQVLKWDGTSWSPGVDNSGGFTLPYSAAQADAATLLNITNTGTGRTAEFNITNATSTAIALRASTTGTGYAISGVGTFVGVSGASTVQNGAAGVFVNSADRGYGVLASLSTSGTSSTAALGTTYVNDGVHFGVGVLASGSSYGIRSTGGIYGGEFLRIGSSHRVLLAGSGASVYASNNENFENGVTAYASGTNSYGVYASGTSAGVYGYSDNGNALEGYSNSTSTGYAVYGRHGQTTGTNAAIHGETNSTSALSVGVRGVSTSTTGNGVGVYGSHAGSGYGVYATTGVNGYGVVASTSGTGYAVYGINGSTGGYAGYFSGRVNVTGALSKGSGTFKIDHPLDPANKFLYHSFVESPDMKNIYDGVVTLDGNGQAEITLPDWFGALNKDFRYQLTCIGGFSPVYVSKEVSNNSFNVAGGTPGMKVSWQLTGIRKDAYAEKNRVKVEEDKTGSERGKYLYPEAFGLSPAMGIGYREQQTQSDVSRPQETAQPKLTAEQLRQQNERITKDPKPDNSKDKGFVKSSKIN